MDTLKEAKVKVGPFDVVVKQELDDYPELSWLGEFTSEEDEFTIDRKRGVLLGKALEEPDMPDDDDSDEVWAEYDAKYTAWEDCPYEVLEEVGKTYERNEFRYWTPCNHREEASQGNQEAVKWIVEDWKRHEGYGNSWNSTGIVVEVYYSGWFVGSDSLWGIESDSPDDYVREVIRDLVSEVVRPSSLGDKIDRLEQELQDLKELLPNITSGTVEGKTLGEQVAEEASRDW